MTSTRIDTPISKNTATLPALLKTIKTADSLLQNSNPDNLNAAIQLYTQAITHPQFSSIDCRKKRALAYYQLQKFPEALRDYHELPASFRVHGPRGFGFRSGRRSSHRCFSQLAHSLPSALSLIVVRRQSSAAPRGPRVGWRFSRRSVLRRIGRGVCGCGSRFVPASRGVVRGGVWRGRGIRQ